MTRPEQISIQKHLPLEELNQRIKSLETDTKILKRLYFVKFRYQGESVEKASERVGITRMVGYLWQERWNEEGYEGLIPRYAGGRPSKLTPEQKERLLKLLRERENWTTEEVRHLIRREFEVEYTLKQVRIILRKAGMRYAKPFPKDHRRPPDAEDILKKTPSNNQ
jgi:putative transposase